MEHFRNKNRGYQQLRVWQDAIELYTLTWRIFRSFPYELKRVSSQAIASTVSVHRNIADGYCRRSIREYLHFLNISLRSLGESVSGLHAYYKAEQITEIQFKELNELSYKLEKRLAQAGRKPRTEARNWRLDRHSDDQRLQRHLRLIHHSNTPSLHHSMS